MSGASRHNRPSALDLISRIPEWDVLLSWDFSRLARDGEDQGWIRNRLRVAKKSAVEVSTGLDLFNVGSKVMGVFAEEYLVKLSADTHRGLQGRVERGFAAGGAPYDFRLEGTFWLEAETGTARDRQASERFHEVVAGGGFEPPTSGL